MKFTRIDWFLLIFIMITSMLLYVFFANKISNHFLNLIILSLSILTGTLRNIYYKKREIKLGNMNIKNANFNILNSYFGNIVEII